MHLSMYTFRPLIICRLILILGFTLVIYCFPYGEPIFFHLHLLNILIHELVKQVQFFMSAYISNILYYLMHSGFAAALNEILNDFF